MVNYSCNYADGLKEFCSRIGKDKLLVQGAGGNVSWKDNSTLWVKASGTWLSSASQNDIFIPVDLRNATKYLQEDNFEFTPQVLVETRLRPSIETMLHAIMPQRVVLHLHLVDLLVHLVDEDFEQKVKKIYRTKTKYAVVEYLKPGPELARAVSKIIRSCSTIDVIFLKNHGVVIGGNTLDDVDKVLKNLMTQFQSSPIVYEFDGTLPMSQAPNFFAIEDKSLHELAHNPALFKRILNDWALYPDHVVFLGPEAVAFNSWVDAKNYLNRCKQNPNLIFIENEGVFVTPSFSLSQHVQLRCYYDVITRIDHDIKLKKLSRDQVNELLDWDAEKFRIKNSL